jgi:membrane protein implicated in regulation of membrane protease activity
MSFWINFGVAIVLVAILILGVWMFMEYFSLKGHFDITDGLIGQLGTVKKECTPHQRGKVYVAGAYWDAICEHGSLHVGEDIKVIRVAEKFLIVVKVDLIGSP